jgi:hypothetical protein
MTTYDFQTQLTKGKEFDDTASSGGCSTRIRSPACLIAAHGPVNLAGTPGRGDCTPYSMHRKDNFIMATFQRDQLPPASKSRTRS